MIKMDEEERKQKARDRAKKYYQENKEKVLARQKEYARKKYHESEEYRKKNYERCKKYKEKNRLKIAMLQRKYMAKKRSLGELPKTKNQIIEELQNNWNELKKFAEDEIIECKAIISTILPEFEKIMPRGSGKTLLTNEYNKTQTIIKCFEVMLNKMQELEQGKDE